MISQNLKVKKRRYKLHQNIKAQYKYSVFKKVVYVPYNDDLTNRFIIELKEKFHYQIQLEII